MQRSDNEADTGNLGSFSPLVIGVMNATRTWVLCGRRVKTFSPLVIGVMNATTLLAQTGGHFPVLSVPLLSGL